MSRSKKKQSLPAVGDAFRVPLGDGMYTFCWVVRVFDRREVYGDRLTGPWGIVIAAARWTGRGRPTQAELDAREVCMAPPPLVVVAQVAPSKRWPKLGKVTNPHLDAPLLPGGLCTLPDGTQWREPTFEGFEGLQRRAERAWRLARDGVKATLAREAEEDAAIEAENAAEENADAERRQERRHATLAQLAKLDLLPEWKGLVPARARTRVQELLVECVTKLRALRKPDRATKLAVIQATVEKINAWNDRASVIETPEREALCNAIDDIGHAAGLRGRDLAGHFRDW
jgi:hypothetical protein